MMGVKNIFPQTIADTGFPGKPIIIASPS